MPLVLVTGLPASGKSTTARELSTFIRAKLEQEQDSRTVRIVSDGDNLNWEGRDSTYTSIPKEKELRAWLRAEAQRYINLNQIVILDAAAYIKGFRYELFCVSKEANTQYCVVELLLEPEVCWRRNEKLVSDSGAGPDEPTPGYARETFDALVMRYEKCDENNRWDSPLFRVQAESDRLNMEELYGIVTKDQPLVPNKCTSLTSTTTTIYKPTS